MQQSSENEHIQGVSVSFIDLHVPNQHRTNSFLLEYSRVIPETSVSGGDLPLPMNKGITYDRHLST